MEFEILQKVIGEVLNVAPDEVTLDTMLVEDFGADSLDLFQVVMGIEEAFGIEIPEDKVKQIATVKEAVSLIKNVRNEVL